MKVKLHTDFVADLIEIGDAKVPSRVLRKLFGKGGDFIEQAKDDHRYHGIKDGWIRYISQGGPAFRVIYTKTGENILLYRVGPHAIEDNLAPPAGDDGHSVVKDEVIAAMQASVGNQYSVAAMFDAQTLVDDLGAPPPAEPPRVPRLMHNHVDRFLYSNLLGRRFLPHRDVYLMSPYLSLDLLRSTHHFGQMLDDLVDSGATVWLISRPPKIADLEWFQQLAARKINVFFSENVHAKVYAFILNRDELKPDQKANKDLIVVGSANLTWSGLNPKGLLAEQIQYELSYELPTDDWPDVEKFLLHVTGLSTELDVLRSNLVS